MGSQNLVPVLNDPTVSRSQSEGIFTKHWGSYFVEMPVPLDPVSAEFQLSQFEAHEVQLEGTFGIFH